MARRSHPQKHPPEAHRFHLGPSLLAGHHKRVELERHKLEPTCMPEELERTAAVTLAAVAAAAAAAAGIAAPAEFVDKADNLPLVTAPQLSSQLGLLANAVGEAAVAAAGCVALESASEQALAHTDADTAAAAAAAWGTTADPESRRSPESLAHIAAAVVAAQADCCRCYRSGCCCCCCCACCCRSCGSSLAHIAAAAVAAQADC